MAAWVEAVAAVPASEAEVEVETAFARRSDDTVLTFSCVVAAVLVEGEVL